MKILKKITLPRILIILSVLFLVSCAAATPQIPEIRLKPGEFGMQINQPSPIISCIAYSPKGRHVAVGKVSGELIIWDISEGRKLWSVEASEKTDKIIRIIVAVFFTPDGRRVLSVTSDGAVKIRDVESGSLLRTFKVVKDNQSLVSAAITPDGKRMLVGGGEGWRDGVLRLWDIESISVIREFPIPQFRPYGMGSVDISPDGRLALASYKYYITIWDIETGREIRKFEHGNWATIPVGNVAFLPDGKKFISEGAEGFPMTIRLWDVETGDIIQRFGYRPYGPTLSPDGRRVLYSELLDGIFKLWDIEKGQIVKKFKGVPLGHSGDFFGWGKISPDGKRMVSFSKDAAIRIWDIDSEDELIVMAAFEDGEWLAITTEGYYNASTNGHKYLNVMLGESKYTAESFYDVFYRPDIVTAKLRGEDIKDLITITMQDAIKTPPPVVEISSFPSTTSDPKVKVCYKAKSTGGGIGEIRLFHNGKLIESDGYYKETAKTSDKMQLAQINSKTIYEDMRSVKIKGIGEISPIKSKVKGEQFEACKEVDAIAGENEISITAFNKDNTVQGYMQTAKFNSTVKQEDANLYILSIGIDQYKDNTINLKYAVKDSRDIKERILKQAETLYKPQNIHHIILSDKDATKQNIISKINELSKMIKPTDSFILFVAGHGILLQNQYYMLTSEYDGNVNEGTMISSNEIVEISKKIKSLSQLFIFDTCHAGGVDYIVSGLYDARMSVLAKKMGLHIYASANSKEQAMDGYQGNGLFTYTLLDGLNNKKEADKNKDNRISLVELGEYSKTTTTEISKKIGHTQTPLIINFGKDNPIYNLK